MSLFSIIFALFTSVTWASEALDCYQQICGNVQPSKIEYTKDQQFFNKLRVLLDQKFERQEQIWQTRYEFLKDVDGDALKLLSNTSEAALFFSQTIAAVFDNFNELYEQEAIGVIHLTSPLIFFEKDKAREILKKKYSSNEVEWLVELNHAFYRDEAYSRLIIYLLSRGIPGYTFNSVLENYEISIFHAMNLEIEAMAKRLNRIDSSLIPAGDQILLDRIKTEFLFYASLKEFPPYIQQEINSNLFMAKIFVDYFEGAQTAFMQVARKVPVEWTQRKLSQIASLPIEDFNPSLQDSSSLALKKNEAINLLLSDVDQRLQRLPTASDILKLQKALRVLKSNLRVFLQKNFGDEFSSYVDQKLYYLQLDVPATQEFLKDFILRKIELELKTPDETAKSFLVLDSSNFTPGDDGSYFTYLAESLFDDATYQDIYDDRILPSKTHATMHVGHKTVQDLSTYIDILAHEMGHYVYDLMKGTTREARVRDDFPTSPSLMTKIQRGVQCVSSNSPFADRVKFKINENQSNPLEISVSRYTSEDFADILASMIVPESSVNSFCVILETMRTLDASNDYMAVVNSNPEDVHSAILYRIINVEYNLRNELPLSCRSLIAVNPSRALNQCFTRD